MKDERYWPVLETWLKDTVTTPPDPTQTARDVTERLPQTRQVRRRWWLPSLRRAPSPPTNNSQATEYQPTSIPATHGHTPTVQGRTQAMFSPAKAITAGALVFAIGGVLLVAQPFDQQGGRVPGAATDAEAMRPALVTGTMEHIYPEATSGRMEMSDARLTGDVTFDDSLEAIPDPILPDIEGLGAGDVETFARLGAEFFWGSLRIENASGTWEGQFVCVPTVATHGFEDPCFIELTGTAAYEGLSAVLVERDRLNISDGANETFVLDGLVLAGDLPPDR